MNLLIFGTCIFDSVSTFLLGFLYSAIYFFMIYGIFGTVAVFIQRKYSAAGDLFKRIFLMLPAFYFMNIGAIYGAYFIFGNTTIYNCDPHPETIWFTVLYACVMSTLITFINEGMANWEKWKNSLAENKRLRNSYQRSKVLGLKGQMNPHFLFNCFNSLSGLIQEDEKLAEKFLDEMTKVHRYLLRSDNEYLVKAEDEIKFAESYLYLIRQRFGNAIQFTVNLKSGLQGLYLPPLSLQVVLEYIIYNNTFSKSIPIAIDIYMENREYLVIRHSVQEKTIVKNLNNDEGLDNLFLKYSLLSDKSMQVLESDNLRTIKLPFFTQKEAIIENT
ncbi:MAG: histidine kinase [Bacteroidetes bacterium]|nr:histidine kinase [Bacteroidota bacterium]